MNNHVILAVVTAYVTRLCMDMAVYAVCVVVLLLIWWAVGRR